MGKYSRFLAETNLLWFSTNRWIKNDNAWIYSFVRSLCCCVRREWDAGKGLWTRPRSSSSGCSLFCVTFSLSRPSCGRRSDRYEPSTRRKKGFSLLGRVPFPFEYLYSAPVFELQNEIQDVPRFCLFYISFGLEVIALILSAIADIPPSKREEVKKVILIVFSLFLIMREYKTPEPATTDCCDLLIFTLIHRTLRQVQHFWAESLSTGSTGKQKKLKELESQQTSIRTSSSQLLLLSTAWW